MNPILTDEAIIEAFIDWVDDHYKHFNVYPGSFIWDDIEYSEAQVWEAIEALYRKK